MKVIGRTFEDEKIVKGLCKMLPGTLEYKLGLLGFMPNLPSLFLWGPINSFAYLQTLDSQRMFRSTK